MTERTRELALVAVVVAALAGGAAYDFAASDATVSSPRPESTGISERAVFCPPAIGEGASGEVYAASTKAEGSTEVGIEPLEEESVELPGDGSVQKSTNGSSPIEVVGFGAAVRASAVESLSAKVGRQGNASGAGAGSCATHASSRWYFPFGSSLIGTSERLLVANPFPGEAVVRVSFITDRGERSSAALADVAVAAGKAEVLDLSGSVLPSKVLAVRVSAARGKVVAWRGLLSRPESGPPGFDFTLGAPAPSTQWYFPEGKVGEGYSERIVLMNPSDREATASISLVTAGRVVQSPRLIEISVPPQGVEEISLAAGLDRKQRQLGGVSATVQVQNGVRVVAERAVVYDQGDWVGRASEVGASAPARDWLVGPPLGEPSQDVLVLMNPSSHDAQVDVSFLTPGGDAEAPRLLQVAVPGGLRTQVALRPHTGGRPLVVRLSSTTEIVAERFGSSSDDADVGSVIGQRFSLPE